MILFDLKCQKNHVFEGWFKDGGAFEAQAKGGKIACPVCGSKKVAKALMAPNIVSGRQKANAEAEMQAKARQMLIKMREHVEQNCEFVGENFAEEARKIHYGEIERKDIYGQATDEEAKELEEEGIEYGRLPWLPRADG